MTQLDFTDLEHIRTADRQERHDAFWGPLNEVRRTATKVACDFFAFADEVQWQIFPAWWTKDPHKNTAYFIGQFAVYSGQYAEYLAKRREEAEKKAAAKQKGGAK